MIGLNSSFGLRKTTLRSVVKEPRPRATTPVASYPKMNDQIQIEIEPTQANIPDSVKTAVITPRSIERFHGKYRKLENGCWEWLAGKSQSGYGHFSIKDTKGKKRPFRAHRISYQIHRGPITNGLWVLHNCPSGDNPACVNPDHLWLGTHLDNVRDKEAKGRGVRLHGEDNPCALLRDDDVREIRAAYDTGWWYQSVLADVLQTNRVNLFNIVRGNVWKHLL